MKIQSILVEGGAKLHQSFIDENCWDEARVITNEQLIIEKGIDSPVLKETSLIITENYFFDSIYYYNNRKNH
jgi:diaminohydroxyphosphoribosylaminopyrimidine deaminase/5-amino-6-(5-phosphoribosylamino)uracil reductase